MGLNKIHRVATRVILKSIDRFSFHKLYTNNENVQRILTMPSKSILYERNNNNNECLNILIRKKQ